MDWKIDVHQSCYRIRCDCYSWGEKRKINQGRINAVNEDGAEVLILGCAGMAGFDKIVENIVKVPVIDGLVCALMMVESLIKYGVKTSKIAKYMWW